MFAFHAYHLIGWNKCFVSYIYYFLSWYVFYSALLVNALLWLI